MAIFPSTGGGIGPEMGFVGSLRHAQRIAGREAVGDVAGSRGSHERATERGEAGTTAATSSDVPVR